MKLIITIIAIVLAVLLVWGFVGGMEAEDPGVTCDMGLGDTFCWKWHTNAVGKVGEFFEDISG